MENPFDGGADDLALEEEDEGQSLRPRLRLTRLGGDEVMVRVMEVDDRRFPTCRVRALVLKAAADPERAQPLRRGRVYHFSASGGVDDSAARGLLGLCYYPPGTRVALRISEVEVETGGYRVATARR